jgi:hypothetical protein
VGFFTCSTIDVGREERVMRAYACHSPSEPDYWLRRCEGFTVCSPPQRHVGLVEEVRYRSRIDRPDVLVVRTSPFRRRLVIVPVEEVEEILPGEELVILHAPPSGGRRRYGGNLRALVPRRGRSARSPDAPSPEGLEAA